MELSVVKITGQNRDELAQIAISTYLGEKCLFCGREYKTVDDLQETVWVGQDENRRLACTVCWQRNGQNN